LCSMCISQPVSFSLCFLFISTHVKPIKKKERGHPVAVYKGRKPGTPARPPI
jgi:hypothetical protein